MRIKTLLSKISLLAITGLLVSNGYSQTCPSGMLSYWKLQEASGYVYADEKGNHDALGATSSPSQTLGISGQAQSFVPNSYLSVASHSDFNWSSGASFSIEFWVKFTSIGSTEVIIGRDDAVTQTHWWLGKADDGRIQWFTRSSDGSNGNLMSNAAINNGQWHYVVAVRDGSQGKHYLYVDGVLQNAGGTVVTLSGNLSSSADLSIGGLIENGVPSYFYNGAIDEVAIYNRVLSSTEINTHSENIRLYQIGYCDGNAVKLLSTPNIYAAVGQQYRYDVDASGNPLPTYSLIEKPTGMAIDASTGLITWTPTSVSQNGHVVVRASNTGGSVDQTFNLFIADVPSCRSNLLAYWDFNETGSAPYFDRIANYKLRGGNPSHTTGRVGTGLSFNGSSDSLNMADNVEPSNIFFDWDNVPSFSIELWMKSSASPSNTMVLVGRDEDANNTQWWLGVNTDGSVGLYMRDYGATPNTTYLEGGTVLDGSWHHIVATVNAGSDDVQLFVDKLLVAEINQPFANFGSNNDMNIGHMNLDPDFYWYEGQLDELAFYNTPLTEEVITSNYNNAVAGKGACVYNFAPVIVSTPVTTVNQGTAYSYKLIATDALENDITSITAVTKPAWLSLSYLANDTTATLSGTPVNANVGVHNVTLRVSDGSINVDQTFQITVADVNDPPAITSTPVATTNEDAAYSYTVVATDPDAGAVLTYSAPVKPAWLAFDAATHILSGTPTNDNVGVFDITVRVNDGTVNIDQSYQLTVNNVNDLPVITTTPPLTINANLPYIYEIIATDVDEGDVLTYTVESKPSWLTFTAATTSGILMGTPAQANMGTHAIILKVSDGHGEVMQGYTLTVTAPSAMENIDNSIINSVYPIPASDVIYLRFAKTGQTRVEILDITGSLHKQVEANDTEMLEINISDLSNGIYIYKVYQEGKVGLGKFTKK
jgi:hypothetical protein